MSYKANKEWRKRNPKEWLAQKACYYEQFDKYGKLKGQKWPIEAVTMITEHKLKDRILAKLLGRSVRAIQVKRSKIKRNSSLHSNFEQRGAIICLKKEDI